jgi:hypothetical protein
MPSGALPSSAETRAVPRETAFKIDVISLLGQNNNNVLQLLGLPYRRYSASISLAHHVYLSTRAHPAPGVGLTPCFALHAPPHFPTALSFPLTLALVFYKLRLVTSLRGAGEVRVVLIGAAARTEERLLLETSYWAEAGHLLPTIDGLHLCFVGPEVRERRVLWVSV